MTSDTLLLLGEIYIDFTANQSTVKMRLGGITHAARGLWACGITYSVAAFCPTYLQKQAEDYLKAHGCADFFIIADVVGSPNVIFIKDSKEVSDQGYEDLLRDERTVGKLSNLEKLDTFKDIVIFPGTFKLADIANYLNPDSRITIDIAYGVDSIEEIAPIGKNVNSITISTSSELFLKTASKDISKLIEIVRPMATLLLLKENRGGSRLFDLKTSKQEEVFANVLETANSVGVGDVYTAVFASFLRFNRDEAVWRGMQAATRYAQTTFPDDFKREIQRDLTLDVKVVQELGGVFLPWHDRPKYEIYLAAPDFSYGDRQQIETAVAALAHHNFTVRRPVLENGEAKPGSSVASLYQFYYKDVELLSKCSLVFAIPLQRDPGTLVEMGMAMALKIPVVTFDPLLENKNTMVLCGSNCYASDLDQCLNATFVSLSKQRKREQ